MSFYITGPRLIAKNIDLPTPFLPEISVVTLAKEIGTSRPNSIYRIFGVCADTKRYLLVTRVGIRFINLPGLTSQDFTAFLPQIKRGEISWYLVQR